jgi:hypothetical protein
MVSGNFAMSKDPRERMAILDIAQEIPRAARTRTWAVLRAFSQLLNIQVGYQELGDSTERQQVLALFKALLKARELTDEVKVEAFADVLAEVANSAEFRNILQDYLN